MNLPNFSQMSADELMAFWSRYHRSSRKDALELLGQRRAGYVKTVETLANYACNLAVRLGCLRRKDPVGALIYEHAALLSVGRLPPDVRVFVRAQRDAA